MKKKLPISNERQINKATSEEIIAYIQQYAVTKDSIVVVRSSNDNKPVLNINTDRLVVGDKLVGSDIAKTLELISYANNLGIEVVSATIYNREYMTVTLKSNIVVIYNDEKDAYEMAAALQNMLAVFTIEGKRPHTIDFRFDKPVVRS